MKDSRWKRSALTQREWAQSGEGRGGSGREPNRRRRAKADAPRRAATRSSRAFRAQASCLQHRRRQASAHPLSRAPHTSCPAVLDPGQTCPAWFAEHWLPLVTSAPSSHPPSASPVRLLFIHALADTLSPCYLFLFFRLRCSAGSQLSSLQEDTSSSSESLWCELHTLKRHLNELEQSQSLKPSSDELQSLEQRIVAQTQQLNSSNIDEQELGQHLRHLLSAAQSAAVSKGDESTENVIAALFEALRSNPFSSSYATREPFTTPYSQRQPTKATDVTHLQHELSSANHEIRKLRDEMNTMKAENASIHHIHEGRRQAHSLSDNQIATSSHVARLEERLNRLEMWVPCFN